MKTIILLSLLMVGCKGIVLAPEPETGNMIIDDVYLSSDNSEE